MVLVKMFLEVENCLPPCHHHPRGRSISPHQLLKNNLIGEMKAPPVTDF